MLICPQPHDVFEYTGGSNTHSSTFTDGSGSGASIISLGSTFVTEVFSGTSTDQGGTFATIRPDLASYVYSNPGTTETSVFSRSYAIAGGTIAWTDSTFGSPDVITSSHSSSFVINRYGAPNLGTSDIGAGPLYYSVTTTDSILHIVGNETTDTTTTVTVISGTKVSYSDANTTIGSSTTVTITVPTFTTKTTPDTITVITFNAGAYTFTTITTDHGTTFTGATYWCTPFIAIGAFKDYQTVYVPEANAIEEDWLWYLDLGSDYTDWAGTTYQFTDLFVEATTDITHIHYRAFIEYIDPIVATGDTGFVTPAISHFIATSTISSITSSSQSYVSVRFSNGEVPTPSYTIGVYYFSTGQSTQTIAFQDTTAYNITAVQAIRVITDSENQPTYAYKNISFYSSSDGGLTTFLNTSQFFSLFHETMQNTISGEVLAPESFESIGQTHTYFDWIGGYSFNVSFPTIIELEPTFIEGFQVQPLLGSTDSVYQWIDATALLDNEFHKVCDGNTVFCPYNDEYILFTTSTSISGFSTITITLTDTEQHVYWDESGKPSATIVSDTDINTVEIFGGGEVGTVMTSLSKFPDQFVRFRIGGRPRAPGKKSVFINGQITYTALSLGSTASGTTSYDAATIELQTDYALAVSSYNFYETAFNVESFFEELVGINIFAFQKHAQSPITII